MKCIFDFDFDLDFDFEGEPINFEPDPSAIGGWVGVCCRPSFCSSGLLWRLSRVEG